MGGEDPPAHTTVHDTSDVAPPDDGTDQARGSSSPTVPQHGAAAPHYPPVGQDPDRPLAALLKLLHDGPSGPSGPSASRFPFGSHGPTNPSAASRPPASGGAPFAAAGSGMAMSSGAAPPAASFGASGSSGPDLGKLLKLHSFRGDRGDDVSGWLFQAREVLPLLSLPEEAKIVYLGQYLHGPAASFYRRYRQSMCDGTVESLMRTLQHTSQTHAEDEHWRARLDRLTSNTRSVSVAEYTRHFNECLFHLPAIDPAECIRL
jgi:hypothetical protein